jgi:lipopolysaccharide transport system permease protein
MGKSSREREKWISRVDLLVVLVQRSLETRYKGSILGNSWPLLNQLFQILIYTYVFSVVLKVKLQLDNFPANELTFGLWLFGGLLPWIAFTNGIIQSSVSVIGQPNLVKKVVFPLALLPLVPVLASFFESCLGLMVLLVLVSFSTQSLHATIFLLPFLWLPQLLLTIGLSYIVAALTVFIRDVQHTLPIFMNLWFYLTPIVYPTTAIPEQFRKWVLWINPLATIAEIYRDLILEGEVKHIKEWGVVSIVSLLIFFMGLKCYQRFRPAFADVI